MDLIDDGVILNKQVADAMGIGENTVKWHLKNISKKLHAPGKIAAALKYSKLSQKYLPTRTGRVRRAGSGGTFRP